MLPQLAQPKRLLSMMGIARTEQTKRQSQKANQSDLNRIARRNARKLAKQGRGMTALLIHIATA